MKVLWQMLSVMLVLQRSSKLPHYNYMFGTGYFPRAESGNLAFLDVLLRCASHFSGSLANNKEHAISQELPVI